MSLTNNSLVNKPSLIEYEQLKFLIMDAPKESNLHVYIRECKKYNVTHIVRISEPSYSKEEVEEAGIQLHVKFKIYFAILLSYVWISGNVLSRWPKPTTRRY
jgi:formyltetrahydrofolate synthetase